MTELALARPIADRVVKILEPHCERIEIAGSIRRERAIISDIEIVCIPKMKPETRQHHIHWINAVLSLGKLLKGKPANGRYIRVQYDLPVDIFTATRDTWGYILAIRTGSAQYSYHVLARGWVKAGYYGENGRLFNENGNQVAVRSEEDLFRLIGIEYTPPQLREV